MDEHRFTSDQVRDLVWILSKAAETLREESDTFRADLVASFADGAALALLDRLYPE